MRTARHAGYDVPVLDLPQRIDRDLGREDYELYVAQPAHVKAEVERARTVLMLRHGLIRGGDSITYETCPRVEVANSTAVVGTTQAVLTSGPLFAGSGPATVGMGGFWYPGRSLRVVLKGTLTSAASAAGNVTPDWKVATSQNVTTGNTLGAGAASVLATSQTNIVWWLEGHIVCRTVGAAGSLLGIAQMTYGVGLISATLTTLVMMPNAAPATAAVDTTANSAVNILITLGSATDSMLVSQGFWEVLT